MNFKMPAIVGILKFMAWTLDIVGFDSLRPSQHFFSQVGNGLPGLNQY